MFVMFRAEQNLLPVKTGHNARFKRRAIVALGRQDAVAAVAFARGKFLVLHGDNLPGRPVKKVKVPAPAHRTIHSVSSNAPSMMGGMESKLDDLTLPLGIDEHTSVESKSDPCPLAAAADAFLFPYGNHTESAVLPKSAFNATPKACTVDSWEPDLGDLGSVTSYVVLSAAMPDEVASLMSNNNNINQPATATVDSATDESATSQETARLDTESNECLRLTPFSNIFTDSSLAASSLSIASSLSSSFTTSQSSSTYHSLNSAAAPIPSLVHSSAPVVSGTPSISIEADKFNGQTPRQVVTANTYMSVEESMQSFVTPGYLVHIVTLVCPCPLAFLYADSTWCYI